MGLNLTIDQGNSSAKIAIWEGGNLVEQETMKELTRQHLVKMVGRFHPERALCCSVTAVWHNGLLRRVSMPAR